MMDLFTSLAQPSPAAAAEWARLKVTGADRSSANLRAVCLGVAAWADVIYTPIFRLSWAALFMLLGALLCSRPVYAEVKAHRACAKGKRDRSRLEQYNLVPGLRR